MKLANFNVGIDQAFFLIAGPCVIESELLTCRVAEQLKNITDELGIHFIFKSSFDKANRTSADSYRGVGFEAGLGILQKIKADIGVPVLTDVHEDTPLDEVASVVDVLQTPAFLVRQTNFIQNVCRQGLPVNIKKGQFQAPADMAAVVEKAKAVGNDNVMICERGTCFGYQNLISDMRALASMRQVGVPIVFDATHSVQQPGALGTQSGGQRQMVPVLARAAVAVGVSGVFMETHPEPSQAKSDGATVLPLAKMRQLLATLKLLDAASKADDFLENTLSN